MVLQLLLLLTQLGTLELDPLIGLWVVTSYSEVASHIDFVSVWKVRIGKELKGFINCLYNGLVFFKMVLQKIALISLIFCNEHVTPSFSPQNQCFGIESSAILICQGMLVFLKPLVIILALHCRGSWKKFYFRWVALKK